jgi:hypothetical protein
MEVGPAPRLPQKEVPRARSSLGREDGTCSRQNRKPFVADPVGSKSYPTRASHPPEASLAWRRGNPAWRSVDSECAGRGNQPREIKIGEPTSWHQRKAISSAPYWLGVEGPPGCVRAQGMYTKGSAQEPGRTLRSPRSSSGWTPEDQRSRPTDRGRPHPVGANRRAHPWYRQAKETKRGGMDSGRLSTLIVPRKRGNHPEGPRGGKGSVGSRNRWRER